MGQYSLQKAASQNISQAMELIEEGRQYLKEQGLDQWQGPYPELEDIQTDIAKERGYFVTDGRAFVAYLCIDFQGEPDYEKIEGQWNSVSTYAVIHRLAISAANRGKGLSGTVFQLAENLCQEKGVPYIRIDTHRNNEPMKHAIQKNGFQYCGIIWCMEGERLAFDKILTKK